MKNTKPAQIMWKMEELSRKWKIPIPVHGLMFVTQPPKASISMLDTLMRASSEDIDTESSTSI